MSSTIFRNVASRETQINIASSQSNRGHTRLESMLSTGWGKTWTAGTLLTALDITLSLLRESPDCSSLRASNRHRRSIKLILPSLLASLPGRVPMLVRCGRRTRPFSGRAFREHRTNVGALPIFSSCAFRSRPLLSGRGRRMSRIARVQRGPSAVGLGARGARTCALREHARHPRALPSLSPIRLESGCT